MKDYVKKTAGLVLLAAFAFSAVACSSKSDKDTQWHLNAPSSVQAGETFEVSTVEEGVVIEARFARISSTDGQYYGVLVGDEEAAGTRAWWGTEPAIIEDIADAFVPSLSFAFAPDTPSGTWTFCLQLGDDSDLSDEKSDQSSSKEVCTDIVVSM